MKWSRLLIVALAVVTLTDPVAGQTAVDLDPGRLHASRAQLEQLLQAYEKELAGEDYSDHLRAIAGGEADLIRARLKEGDFQVGDQIVLAVAGQQSLTATFTVTDGRRLVLPDVGEVPLAGLLRSELKAALTDHIAKYVRNPQLHVQANIRIAVFGEIGKPGYHVAPSESLLTDVLMLAGGPTRSAKQQNIKIRRNGDVIWEGNTLQDAMVEGRTLDQLSLRAGDEVQVPGSGASFSSIVHTLRAVPFIITGFIAVSRLLK